MRQVFGFENVVAEGYLQLSGLYQRDYSLDDGIFVVAVILCFEVVAEEFGYSLPEVSGKRPTEEFDNIV